MKKVHLLPNLLTAGNFFCGIVSITHSLNGQFVVASIWIFIAMFFDFFDGHMARISKSASKFGEQFDSLSDLLGFGIAPMIMVYEMSLNQFGRLGLAIAFIYAVCAALRLARYNARLNPDVKRTHFDGLPTPAAAGLICSSVLAASRYDLKILSTILPFLMILAAFLMVSNFEYPSVQAFGLKNKKPFVYLVLTIFALGGLIFFIELFLMIFALLYAMLGFTGDWLIHDLHHQEDTQVDAHQHMQELP
ncbi:MAG: CDP-diacylglycerol--serine O-phosphatidyltransferase [Chlamydiota bacterium]|nr:CDP-diacylglycerol--serine O-phosphatidyltransferase [Chlamydiota bacterium]